MKTIKEEWLPVAGYEDEYQVSNLGSVKSLNRYTKSRFSLKKSPGKVLKGEVGKVGYIRFQLSKNGITKRYFIHRLVASAFIPN